jgi:hypothetical protein
MVGPGRSTPDNGHLPDFELDASGARDHLNRRGHPGPTVEAESRWAKSATRQRRIIRRYVLFESDICQVAAENLLHCDRIGAIQDEDGRSRMIIEHHAFG